MHFEEWLWLHSSFFSTALFLAVSQSLQRTVVELLSRASLENIFLIKRIVIVDCLRNGLAMADASRVDSRGGFYAYFIYERCATDVEREGFVKLFTELVTGVVDMSAYVERLDDVGMDSYHFLMFFRQRKCLRPDRFEVCSVTPEIITDVDVNVVNAVLERFEPVDMDVSSCANGATGCVSEGTALLVI